MYVCMYVYMYVCMYVCMHACMYVHMHVCMYICMYVLCVYACMYVLLVCYYIPLSILSINPFIANLIGFRLFYTLYKETVKLRFLKSPFL